MSSSIVDRWMELPKHIFDLVTKRLELEDLIRVSCVCHTWKSFVSSLLPTNLNPWLIVPQKDSTNNEATTYGQTLGFFNLSDRRVYKIETPAIADRRICGSCQGGWLITVHENGEIQMLHPFSKVVIDLPLITKLPGVVGSCVDQDGDLVYYIPTSNGKKEVRRENIVASCIRDIYIYKVIMSSSNPSTCIVMAIQGLFRLLAFCRPGMDKKWSSVKGGDRIRFADVTYFKGKFYAVNNSGKVFVVDGLDGDSPCLKLFIDSARSYDLGKYYLVESLGELMLVWRMTYAPLDLEEMMEDACEENYPSYKTRDFTVCKLDFNGPKWVGITEIDRALFVGYNHSFSISTSDLVGCKRNSIYFTDDNMDEYTDQPFGGHDLGVFNMSHGGIQRLYPSDSKFLLKPPPVWYTTMSASMVDRWTELPKHIFDLITKRLELNDIIQASYVCHTWKSFASSLLPVNLNPWLIVPQEDSNNEGTTYGQTLGFLNLSDRKVYKIKIPGMVNRRICGSCRGGWLITVHEKGEIQILHPFSKVVIDLPPITKLPGVGGSFIDKDGDLVYDIPTNIGKKVHRKNITASCIRDIYIYKAIMSSSNPNTCIVMAIQGLFRLLAFCRPGRDKKWRLVKGGDRIRFADVTYFKGKFYAVNNSGKVFVVDGLDSDSPCLKLFIDSARSYNLGKYYLVESLGELMLVWRMTYAPLDLEEMMEDACEENYPSYKTRDFTVRKLDFNGPKWVDITEIDCALFVGYNHSFSISTSDLVGCKRNSIYFTDDNMDEYTDQPFGGHDLGVFNMSHGGIQRLYPSDSKFLMKPPPVWFTTVSC